MHSNTENIEKKKTVQAYCFVHILDEIEPS